MIFWVQELPLCAWLGLQTRRCFLVHLILGQVEELGCWLQ